MDDPIFIIGRLRKMGDTARLASLSLKRDLVNQPPSLEEIQTERALLEIERGCSMLAEAIEINYNIPPKEAEEWVNALRRTLMSGKLLYRLAAKEYEEPIRELEELLAHLKKLRMHNLNLPATQKSSISDVQLKVEISHKENKGGLFNYAPKTLTIEGKVKNMGESPVKLIKVNVKLVKSGSVVDMASTFVSGELLLPTEQSTFAHVFFDHVRFDQYSAEIREFYLMDVSSQEWRRLVYNDDSRQYDFR